MQKFGTFFRATRYIPITVESGVVEDVMPSLILIGEGGAHDNNDRLTAFDPGQPG